MKIAHVITRLIIGGAQENTVLSCEGLTAKGHEVTLISGPETGPEGSLWPRAEKSCSDVIRVNSLLRNINPAAELRCVRDLQRIFREHRFDVVHTHSSKAGILGRYAAYRAGIPNIVHTIHGMSFNRTQGNTTRAVYRMLEKRAASWTSAFVSVADAMTEQAVAAGIAERRLFTTIRSGMETELFRKDNAIRKSMRESWGIPTEAIVVGTIARLFRNKGYEHLLKALPAITFNSPEAHFVWVGDGIDREKYVSELRRLGLENKVHFTGLVPPAEIPGILNGFDILVHASMWEGLPRALVQASLTEVPVVSFDNDGAPEVVEEGVTGFLAPMGNAAILGEKLTQLCKNTELRVKMGQLARTRCLEEFDHKRMVEELDKLYARLVG